MKEFFYFTNKVLEWQTPSALDKQSLSHRFEEANNQENDVGGFSKVICLARSSATPAYIEYERIFLFYKTSIY